MADKTIGDLPAASAIYDDDLFLLEQSGEAKKLRGALYKAYLQGFVDAASAASSEAAAALAGVRDAINNIPEGAATPIVNDLTTGGTSMALSAEMGKVLKNELDSLTPEDIGAVPLDGSKAMTGNFAINKNGAKITLGKTPLITEIMKNSTTETDYGTILRDYARDGRYVYLKAYASTQKMLAGFLSSANGTTKEQEILHTGNKPSGSYTGNGSAARRTIETGGIGNVIAVWSGEWGYSLIFGVGAFAANTNGAQFYPPSEAQYGLERITYNTASEMFNANGITYYYQVL